MAITAAEVEKVAQAIALANKHPDANGYAARVKDAFADPVAFEKANYPQPEPEAPVEEAPAA